MFAKSLCRNVACNAKGKISGAFNKIKKAGSSINAFENGLQIELILYIQFHCMPPRSIILSAVRY